MAVSYNKLWKLMIDKKINKSKLCKKIKISSSTMAKITLDGTQKIHDSRRMLINDEGTYERIMSNICDISDIMEFTDLAEVKKKIHNENTSPDNGTVNVR